MVREGKGVKEELAQKAGVGRGILNSRTQYYEYMQSAQRFTALAHIFGRRLEG